MGGTNNATIPVYAIMRSFCSLFILIKYSWMALIICVLPFPIAPPRYCNILLMEFICMNVSNAEICNLFNFFF